MKDRDWQVAIFGTFDVENYGDLLFPIIAKTELSKRLGAINIHPYSYHARSASRWPYSVNSVTEFPTAVDNFDGILVGGGHIIRFDKGVAPAYGPPTPAIHHPTGYWLTPGLIALQHDVPVIWNAPGFHGAIPLWSEPLLKLTLQLGSYISVRDKYSEIELSRIDGNAQIHILPDTAFAISRLINVEQPSAEFIEVRQNYGLTKPYIIIQAASHGLAFFLRLIKNNRNCFQDYVFLVLPIGPAVGDDEKFINIDLPEIVKLPFWPSPLLIAELISHAAGVVGHSYHLSITALAFGVPVFSTVTLSAGKLSVLSKFEGIYPLPIEGDIYPQWVLKRLGKTVPCQAAIDTLEQLDAHWDRIAYIIRNGGETTSHALNEFWLSLPNILETATNCCEELEAELIHSRQQLIELNARLNIAESTVGKLYGSLSFRITSPLRVLMGKLKRLIGK